jgi:hypothetical protein
MGILRVLVFFHVQKGVRDKPSRHTFWTTVGLPGSLQTRETEGLCAFKTQALVGKKERKAIASRFGVFG